MQLPAIPQIHILLLVVFFWCDIGFFEFHSSFESGFKYCEIPTGISFRPIFISIIFQRIYLWKINLNDKKCGKMVYHLYRQNNEIRKTWFVCDALIKLLFIDVKTVISNEFLRWWLRMTLENLNKSLIEYIRSFWIWFDFSRIYTKPYNFNDPRHCTQSHKKCKCMKANHIALGHITNPTNKWTNQKHKESLKK